MSIRVLVVSARTAFAEPLSVGLRAADLDYAGANNADKAIRVLREEPTAAAVIIDLLTIGGDVSFMCDAVRALDGGAQVPVLFAGTGTQEIKSMTDALFVGGDGYFQMPISVAKVVAKIATYLGCSVPELPSSLMLTDAIDELATAPPEPPRTQRDEADADGGEQSARAGHAFNVGDLDEPVAEAPNALLGATSASTSSADIEAERARAASIEEADIEAEVRTALAAYTESERARAAEEARVEATRLAKAERPPSNLSPALLELERNEELVQARAAADELARRTREEERRLAELTVRRAAAEQETARAREESERRRAQESARLEVLAQQRQEAERAATRAAEEARAREAVEQARLFELEVKRAAAEAEGVRARVEAEQRQAEESARLDELTRRRRAAEAESERALEESKRHQDEERALLIVIEQHRRDAEGDAARALDEAQRRRAQEQSRLDHIEQERRVAEANAAHSMAEAVRREAEERQRLEELQQQCATAEAELARTADTAMKRAQQSKAALEESERREVEERQRLLELGVERERAEEEAQVAIVAARRRAEELNARLLELESARVRAEEDARVALDEARGRAEKLNAHLLDLEAARMRANEEDLLAEEGRRRRADDERRRLLEIELTRERLEEAARTDAAARQEREIAEEMRLAEMIAQRERDEQEMRAALIEKERRLREEDESLAALKEAQAQAGAEYLRRIGEQERLAQEAEDRLANAHRQNAQAEVEAQEVFKRLAHVRAEQALEVHELEEKRARARLAFQTGRLDGVPTGMATAGLDVGSELRPSTDANGTPLGAPHGGGDGAEEREPPPPPPFVPLEPPRGRFAEGELPSLLWACHHLGVTGALELAFDGDALAPHRIRTVFFQEGEPLLVSSTLPVDRPEEALLRAGLVTAAKYNELRAGPLRSPRRTAAALAAEGALKPEELFPAVRGVLTEQVMSLLEHDSGTFCYREEHAHAADRVRLEHSLDALLAEAVRRKYDERRLWLVLGGPASLLAPDHRGHDLPPLSPEEKLALARLDGSRTLEDVIVETGVDATVVLRTALIALSASVVKLLARGVPVDPSERQVQHDRSLAIDRARILDRLHAGRNGDYFSFLGVDLHAAPFEVHRAAERVRQRFDPLRFSDPAFAELKAALQEIIDVSFDAEVVLADESLANGYRKNLLGNLERPALKRRA